MPAEPKLRWTESKGYFTSKRGCSFTTAAVCSVPLFGDVTMRVTPDKWVDRKHRVTFDDIDDLCDFFDCGDDWECGAVNKLHNRITYYREADEVMLEAQLLFEEFLRKWLWKAKREMDVCLEVLGESEAED